MKRILFALILIAAVAAAPGARVSAQTVIVNGFPMGGKLGVTLQDVTRKLAEREKLSVSEGAYVSGVSEESPAEKAGLKAGDNIIQLGPNKIASLYVETVGYMRFAAGIVHLSREICSS